MRPNSIKKETLIIGSLIALFTLSIILTITQQIGLKKNTATNAILSGTAGIGLIQIYGPISVANSPSVLGQNGSDAIIAQIKALKEDPRMKALVIRINSPGGTVGASQEIYREILRLKASTKVPIVISIADIGASGGFWIAMAGDTIFANPGSMVGNIGVIMNTLDISTLTHKWGIDMNTYKSAEFKDMGSMWRKPNASETALLQELVKSVHTQFVSTVQTARHLPKERVERLADGRIYTGEQALTVGLIDHLGDLEDAIAFAQKKAGLKGNPNILTKSQYPLQEFLNMWRTESQTNLKNVILSPMQLLH